MTPKRDHPVRSAAAALLFLQACSGPDAQKAPEPPARQAEAEPSANAAANANATGFAPGESLAVEWSANGFEQLPAQYVWTGSGTRDDAFEPHLSLSVPETDDAIWSSQCAGDGKVKTTLYLARPGDLTGDRARLRFETDTSGKILDYDARYVSGGQYDGFEILTDARDPLFAAMAAGAWAYVQIGDGARATKLRISLARAGEALDAFLPACATARTPA